MATRIIKTQVTGTSTQKFTLSAWVKKASNTANNDQVIYESYADGNSRTTLYFRGNNGNRLNLFCFLSGSTVCEIETTRKFRDINCWYNIVLKVDTTQGTASNRVKFYVNGVEETALTISTYPSQNAYLPMGTSSYQHAFGFYSGGGSSAFQGSMSHLHFIDGTAYDASYFGSTDANGVWTINTSPSVTYGNNGFFILKDGNSLTDQSGKGNNFTLSTGTLTKTEDSPSNVFATLNRLIQLTDATLSNGNNSCAYGSAGSRAVMLGTLGMSSGKYYMEFKISASSTSPCNGSVGVINGSDNSNMGTYLNQDNSKYQGAGYQLWDGNKNINQTGSAYGATVTTGDIVGMAVDIDNKALYFHKNGAYQNSGSPTSGASKTGAIDFSSLTDNGFWFPLISDASGTQTMTYQCNFGNGYFGTTAVSSAGTNASGNGIFEYDVPTGYTALSTKGLNL